MKITYGYIRVSTVKQGTGVSLQEQKDAIYRYAEKHNLQIVEWFEELETAARQGRPLFTKMLKLLKSGKADGVIIHKIDRSARNLKDWASLGDLIDEGIEVHFAHESLDLETRGGRLAADIQAVIASDYIRNLRDEAIKGLYGRLKQGIYPFHAPIGYTNTGRGNPKAIDPKNGPLIKKAFNLYATEKYSLNSLIQEMDKVGLKNSTRGKLNITSMAKILSNPFYAGIMKVKGNSYKGNHLPLISTNLFFRVKAVLKGKTNSRLIKHGFLFRRLIKCYECGYSMIGETKKGHIYYRCHTKDCSTKSVREEIISCEIVENFKQINIGNNESVIIEKIIKENESSWFANEEKMQESLRLQSNQLLKRLDKLTDVYLDGTIEKNEYEDRRSNLLLQLQELKNSSADIQVNKQAVFIKVRNFFYFLNNVQIAYSSAIAEEKRSMIKSLTSDIVYRLNKLSITMKSPFTALLKNNNSNPSEVNRDRPRTFVADLAINSVTKVAEPINIQAIVSQPEDNANRKESLKQLVDMVIQFFTEEQLKVENDELKEEDTLLSPYVQADYTNSKCTSRSLPPQFKRKRA